jgi:hypothetical protein
MISQTEFSRRLAVLGLRMPKSLGLLPLNVDAESADAELHHVIVEKELMACLREAGLDVEPSDPNPDPLYMDTRSNDLVLPGLVVAAALWENRPLADLAVNVIGNYLYDKMKAVGEFRQVQMRLYRKRGKSFEILDYSGPLEGFRELTKWQRKDG